MFWKETLPKSTCPTFSFYLAQAPSSTQECKLWPDAVASLSQYCSEFNLHNEAAKGCVIEINMKIWVL